MRISFLFWNLNGRDVAERLARIAAAHSVDILVLAECSIKSDALVRQLDERGNGPHVVPFSEGRRIRIATRLPHLVLTDDFNDPLGGLTIR